MVSLGWDTSLSFVGEKLTDEEVDTLLQGVEDNQGQVNYEGWLFYLMLPGNHTTITDFVKMVLSGWGTHNICIIKNILLDPRL